MSERRLRVLVMTSTFPRWPRDTQPAFVYNLSARLTQKFDVTILAPHAPHCKAVEQWDGLRVLRFRYFWPERFELLAYGGILANLERNRLLWFLVPFFLAAEFLAALRATYSYRIDVLHAHWVIPQGIVATLVGWITRRPVLITCHAADIYGLRGWLRDRVRRWALNRCSYITAVSHGLLEAIRALRVNGQIPSAVISMGVDTNDFHPQKRDQGLRERLCGHGPMLLFVGRLVEKKGVEYLLGAMPAVLQTFPDATLVIVGDGHPRSDLEALAKSLRVDGHVRFVGAVPHIDLPSYYATADLFVGPSIVASGGDAEGLPVVFIEAMSSGCPTVGSDVGGMGEVIVHDRTGIMVRERDPEAIAGAICNLLGDPVLMERLRNEALLWVRERFNQQLLANKYGEVITRVGEDAL